METHMRNAGTAEALVIEVATPDGVRPLVCAPDAEGRLVLDFDAAPGLYQFSVVADAREFDWESLYEPLFKFHNTGQLTGPWDFSINHENRPLVPSYWVTLNGRRLGLWFFQRVSLDDLEHKRFRGHVAFYAEGPTRLELLPYRPFTIRWSSARLEPDPDDHLLPALPQMRDPAVASPAAQWADPAYWARMREALETTHRQYREPLQRAFDWILRPPPPHDSLQKRLGDHDGLNVSVLVTAYGLTGRDDYLHAALALVDNHLDRPAWGNPDPEGYSHNGDMGAATTMLGLAWAYHALRDQLGDERRARLVEKLRDQGNKFVEQALLTRDYWGGSVQQDHGWRSVFAFGAAALHLVGIIPEAEFWLRYYIPRLRRSLAATPRDGAVPLSSYQGPHMYMDYTTHYRQALLALTGEDIFDQAPFHEVIDYVLTVLSEDGKSLLASGVADDMPLLGAIEFYNRAAVKWGDGRAAYLAERALAMQPTDFSHPVARNAFYQGAVWGFLSYDPAVRPEQPSRPPAHLAHFQDSGLVHYRDAAHGVALALKCAPFDGFYAYLHAFGPCDRLNSVPASGHFTLYLQDRPVLCSPDSGYRLRTALRNCLLIGGRGQYGDLGYPMSLPSWRWRGDQVLVADWNSETGEGLIRLNLGPAYPAEAGVGEYLRDFLLFPERRLIVRDTVTLDEPRDLAWLFQGTQEEHPRVEALTGYFGTEPVLRVRPRALGVDLRARVAETEVVYAYSSRSGFQPFAHVRYDTVQPAAQATVEFVMEW
jgi:hypothetical protein